MGKNKNYNKNSFKKPKTDSTTSSSSTTSFEEKEPDYLIDGSILEGGGQILRNSVALSALFDKTIRIEKIRYNRDQPGLKNQHKTGIDLMAKLFKAKVNGSAVGSSKLYFEPTISSILDNGVIEADTKTAGSISLLIQVTLPCMIFAPHSTKMVLGGGTNCDFAPPVDYIENVFLPIATTMGFKCDLSIDKRGYFPKGGGGITITTQPLTEPLSPITIVNKGNVNRIVIQSYFTSGRINITVADRMNQTAKKIIKKDFKKIEIETEVHDVAKSSFGDGTFIMIKAYTDTGCVYGSTQNGAIGIPAEKVAEDAANSILKDLQDGGCMDEYLQDQLIIFMALAKGKSSILTGPISLHTQTSIHITSLMTGATFTCTPVTNNNQTGEQTNLIECNGIAYFPSTTNSNATAANNSDSNTNTTTTTTTNTVTL